MAGTQAFVTGAGASTSRPSGLVAAYCAAALCVGLAALATLRAEEPDRPADVLAQARNALDWLRDSAVAPLRDFFGRLGWLAALVLTVIVFYKFGDAMLGRMAGVFYVDLGFTKVEIANYTKSVGLFATLVGVGVGGWVCIRIGIMRAMFLGAFLMMVTNLAFALLANSGKVSIAGHRVFFDNLTGGMATTALVAYLSSLCNVAFTATQYALLASLGNFSRINWLSVRLGGRQFRRRTLFFVGVAAMSTLRSYCSGFGPPAA